MIFSIYIPVIARESTGDEHIRHNLAFLGEVSSIKIFKNKKNKGKFSAIVHFKWFNPDDFTIEGKLAAMARGEKYKIYTHDKHYNYGEESWTLMKAIGSEFSTKSLNNALAMEEFRSVKEELHAVKEELRAVKEMTDYNAGIEEWINQPALTEEEKQSWWEQEQKENPGIIINHHCKYCKMTIKDSQYATSCNICKVPYSSLIPHKPSFVLHTSFACVEPYDRIVDVINTLLKEHHFVTVFDVWTHNWSAKYQQPNQETLEICIRLFYSQSEGQKREYTIEAQRVEGSDPFLFGNFYYSLQCCLDPRYVPQDLFTIEEMTPCVPVPEDKEIPDLFEPKCVRWFNDESTGLERQMTPCVPEDHGARTWTELYGSSNVVRSNGWILTSGGSSSEGEDNLRSITNGGTIEGPVEDDEEY